MPRKTIERLALPQENLRPVGHVFVAKRTRADGMNHGGAGLLIGRLVLYADRSAIPVALFMSVIGSLSQRGNASDGYALPEKRTQIPLYLLRLHIVATS